MQNVSRDRLVLASLLVAAAACGEVAADEDQAEEQHLLKGTEEQLPGAQTTNDFQWKARQPRATTHIGDFNGDGKSDIAINHPDAPGLGVAMFGDLWIGTSNGTGGISVNKINHQNFSSSGLLQVGDYDGDGKDDLFNFLIGGFVGAYYLIPAIGQSNLAGDFEHVGVTMPQTFLDLAATSGVRTLSCDINGDGKDDIVLTGPAAWTTIPVAYSSGNGTFTMTNATVANFPTWASAAGSQLACDDFNGDNRDDLLLIGGAGWNSIPVAFSLGNGFFSVTAQLDSFWPVWATHSHAQLATSDFNGDGRADIMLTGNSSWGTTRVGLSGGTGTFGVALSPTVDLHLWAMEPQSRARGGDFNGDGLGDFTLLGGADYWFTLPIGVSNGDTTFTTWNQPVP